ncbi:hypothetical protein M1E37_004054 [Enterobacter hormaechei]|nr:hypothetical protein [Enterobacter hormaechei]EJM7582751.1 hypothetical protein [Enterobacter hormaechei]EKT8067987.1 hypothetical protein [Enterobacter hormaechei]EKW0530835.1 hypothetical protein [Enterobacter hormaechei]
MSQRDVKDFLDGIYDDFGIDVELLARSMAVSIEQATALPEQRKPIADEDAYRLSYVVGRSPNFWAQKTELTPLAELPIDFAKMVKLTKMP